MHTQESLYFFQQTCRSVVRSFRTSAETDTLHTRSPPLSFAKRECLSRAKKWPSVFAGGKKGTGKRWLRATAAKEINGLYARSFTGLIERGDNAADFCRAITFPCFRSSLMAGLIAAAGTLTIYLNIYPRVAIDCLGIKPFVIAFVPRERAVIFLVIFLGLLFLFCGISNKINSFAAIPLCDSLHFFYGFFRRGFWKLRSSLTVTFI